MRRFGLGRVLLGALFLLLAAGGWVLHQEVGRTFSADPTVWEPEIAAFEREDRESPPPDGAVVFTGSSSIRFWEGLAEDMAPLPIIRRGFGGARLSDLVHFADRIILPYASTASAIVIHAGGNELNDVPGSHLRTPDEAHGDFETLVGLIRARDRDVPIYYLALRPSNVPGPRDRLLELIRTSCETQPGLQYLDASDVLALPNGAPNPALLSWDYIHLNRDGYAAWAPPIRDRLLRDLGPAQAPGPPERVGDDG